MARQQEWLRETGIRKSAEDYIVDRCVLLVRSFPKRVGRPKLLLLCGVYGTQVAALCGRLISLGLDVLLVHPDASVLAQVRGDIQDLVIGDGFSTECRDFGASFKDLFWGTHIVVCNQMLHRIPDRDQFFRESMDALCNTVVVVGAGVIPVTR